VQLRGLETRCRTDRAIDVGSRATDSTHDVVVVVADACLVTGGASRRFDTTDKIRRREGPQRVVHRLSRNAAQLDIDGMEDRLHVRVRLRADLFEDSQAHRCDASTCGTEEPDVVPCYRHHLRD